MTPSVDPNSPFSERVCSREGEVSLGTESCHPTESSVIASGVHSLECEFQQLQIFLFISRFSCVGLNILVSDSASWW